MNTISTSQHKNVKCLQLRFLDYGESLKYDLSIYLIINGYLPLTHVKMNTKY